MVMRNDPLAQAIYLAQLEAAKGTCKCKVCQLMRKASKNMVDQFLATGTALTPNPGEDTVPELNTPGEET